MEGIGMLHEFSRTALLLGDTGIERLAAARVAVFGVGGVGGYAVEALARSGVGSLDLIDNDRVSLTNINRQILATHETVGRSKVEVARERVLSINPDCHVRIFETFYLPETADLFDFKAYDYIIDAIDTVSGKLALVENAKKAGTPIICSMGAGNKLDPTAFRVADIYETAVCPLAKVMRAQCRKRGIEHLRVVYSEELPLRPAASEEQKGTAGRAVPGSTAFVPPVVGLIIAGEVIKDLSGYQHP